MQYTSQLNAYLETKINLMFIKTARQKYTRSKGDALLQVIKESRLQSRSCIGIPVWHQGVVSYTVSLGNQVTL